MNVRCCGTASVLGLSVLVAAPASLAQTKEDCAVIGSAVMSALDDFRDIKGAKVNSRPTIGIDVHKITKEFPLFGVCRLDVPQDASGAPGNSLLCVLDVLVPPNPGYVHTEVTHNILTSTIEGYAKDISTCLGNTPELTKKPGKPGVTHWMYWWKGQPRPSWLLNLSVEMAGPGLRIAPNENAPTLHISVSSPLRREGKQAPRGVHASRPGLDANWKGNGWYERMELEGRFGLMATSPHPSRENCERSKGKDDEMFGAFFKCIWYHHQSNW